MLVKLVKAQPIKHYKQYSYKHTFEKIHIDEFKEDYSEFSVKLAKYGVVLTFSNNEILWNYNGITAIVKEDGVYFDEEFYNNNKKKCELFSYTVVSMLASFGYVSRFRRC